MKLLLLLLVISCQNVEQLDTLEEGVANFSQSVRDIPKTVVRDALDIEDEDEKSVDQNSPSGDNKEVDKLKKRIKRLEDEKKDVDKDLEEVFDRLECASSANGLRAVKECLDE